MRSFFLVSAAIFSMPSTAFAEANPIPPIVEVKLSSFSFEPGTIHLKSGEPIILHLVNTGSGGHNFTAPEFFAAAGSVSGPVHKGTVEVGGHKAVDIRLTPAHGAYHLRCSHTFHTTFGMHGEIDVQ